MDTKTLLAETKARFNHNSARAQLKDKYDGKLIVADQGGLWRADQQTISFLNSVLWDEVILIDTFNNPVKVKRTDLLMKLCDVYSSVMEEWYREWKELEQKR